MSSSQVSSTASAGSRCSAERLGGAGEQHASGLGAIDRVLDDHVVIPDEVNGLVAVARDWGLSPAQVREAHHLYLCALVGAAWDDGIVTDAERRELETVGFGLGVDRRR